MRYFSYLNTAVQILERYDGSTPFATWVKEFFRENKKYGSTDRKHIAHLCYCYFRLGKAVMSLDKKKALTYALFLCSQASNEMLEQLEPGLNKNVHLLPEEKFALLQHEISWSSIFPYDQQLSGQADHRLISFSFLVQPDLFLRIRPGNAAIVKSKLKDAEISFYEIAENALGMPNGTKVEDVLMIDREVVIQDINSQHTLDMLHDFLNEFKEPEVWDCCAASGGKSLMLHDMKPEAKLVLSDLRNKIISKLLERFERAGIRKFIFSVEDASVFTPAAKYDLVLCDAPCSGSGTWSRTPEQLYFFKPAKLDHYTALQKRIVLNAAKAVRENGYFLYITCSVFKSENEEVVEFIQNSLPLKLQRMQYYKGYDKKADTLFAALFTS